MIHVEIWRNRAKFLRVICWKIAFVIASTFLLLFILCIFPQVARMSQTETIRVRRPSRGVTFSEIVRKDSEGIETKIRIEKRNGSYGVEYYRETGQKRPKRVHEGNNEDVRELRREGKQRSRTLSTKFLIHSWSRQEERNPPFSFFFFFSSGTFSKIPCCKEGIFFFFCETKRIAR